MYPVSGSEMFRRVCIHTLNQVIMMVCCGNKVGGRSKSSRRGVQWRIEDFPEGAPTAKVAAQTIMLAFSPEDCMKLETKLEPP